MQWLASDWQVDVVRCAMGAAASRGGYLDPEKQATHMQQLQTCVDTAISSGIYVIIDWHEDGPEGAGLKADAMTFFETMVSQYGSYPNVIFETFNEPMNSDSWSGTIKPYHEAVNAVIRQHSSNIIIMGTKSWSQDVDEAAADPVVGDNLVYALHFYASSHGASIRQKARTAIEQHGVALFASEWGVCRYDGGEDHDVDWSEVGQWMDLFTEFSISSTYWSISDKVGEACSALQHQVSSSEGQWPAEHLSESGTFIKEYIKTNTVNYPHWWNQQSR